MDRDTAKKILTETFVYEILSTEYDLILSPYNVIEGGHIIRIANVNNFNTLNTITHIQRNISSYKLPMEYLITIQWLLSNPIHITSEHLYYIFSDPSVTWIILYGDPKYIFPTSINRDEMNSIAEHYDGIWKLFIRYNSLARFIKGG